MPKPISTKPTPLHAVILADGVGNPSAEIGDGALLSNDGQPALQQVLDIVNVVNPVAVHLVCSDKESRILQEAFVDKGLVWVEHDDYANILESLWFATEGINDAADMIVLYPNMPWLDSDALVKLVSGRGKLSLLVSGRTDIKGQGTVVLDQKCHVQKIVAATGTRQDSALMSTGVFSAATGNLRLILESLNTAASPHEFSLANVVERAISYGQTVEAHRV